eukprot:11295485-Alexandrium_andersonii.AAC.1
MRKTVRSKRCDCNCRFSSLPDTTASSAVARQGTQGQASAGREERGKRRRREGSGRQKAGARIFARSMHMQCADTQLCGRHEPVQKGTACQCAGTNALQCNWHEMRQQLLEAAEDVARARRSGTSASCRLARGRLPERGN